jgi:hypothetical protein
VRKGETYREKSIKERDATTKREKKKNVDRKRE